jgi:TatD DNase family protein
MFIDTHAHLTSSECTKDLEGMLMRARHCGVDKIVNICTDEKTLQDGMALRKQHPWIYTTAATTPHDVEKEGASFFPLVEKAARAGGLIAIGETGLDYHYTHSPRDTQCAFLLRYFALAASLALPLIFHCRDAFKDLFALADAHYKGKPALLHCFTGTLEEAKGVLERGWYLSFSGIVTFKKAQELQAIVPHVPSDRLLIETDAPYLAPHSKRGKINEPSFLVETAERIAALRNMAVDELAVMTSRNAEGFFSF